MSCHQSINTNLLLRQVQEQVRQYRTLNDTQRRLSSRTTKRIIHHNERGADEYGSDASFIPTSSLSMSVGPNHPSAQKGEEREEEEAEVESTILSLPSSMMLRPCMTQAIQTNLLNDTIVIPIQLKSVHHTHISGNKNKNCNMTPKGTMKDLNNKMITSTEDSITNDDIGYLPSAVQPPTPQPPLPSTTTSSSSPKTSLGYISPPRSFKKLIRLTSKGNRRSRSESSESSSSNTTMDTFPIVPTTISSSTIPDIKEIHTLPPVRFSTLMTTPVSSPLTTSSSSLLSTITVNIRSGSIGSMVLLIRRPGCAMCQQHAYTLTILSQLITCPEYFSNTTNTTTILSSSLSPMENTTIDTAIGMEEATKSQQYQSPMFTIFGIVKDIYDTVGIIECQQLYFPFPLYMNPTYTFYQAFGDRKLSLSHIFTSSQAWKTMFCNLYQNLFPPSSSSSYNHSMAVASTKNSSSNSYSSSSTSSAVVPIHPTSHINQNPNTASPEAKTTSTTATPENIIKETNDVVDTTPTNHIERSVSSTTVSSNRPTTVTPTTIPPPPQSSPQSSSSHKADGILQGGILFLSSTGIPMAMYPEETGQPLNIGYILQTLDYMIQRHYINQNHKNNNK